MNCVGFFFFEKAQFYAQGFLPPWSKKKNYEQLFFFCFLPWGAKVGTDVGTDVEEPKKKIKKKNEIQIMQNTPPPPLTFFATIFFVWVVGFVLFCFSLVPLSFPFRFCNTVRNFVNVSQKSKLVVCGVWLFLLAPSPPPP